MNLLERLQHLVHNSQPQSLPQAVHRNPNTFVPYADPNQAAMSLQRGQGFIPYADPRQAEMTTPGYGSLQMQANRGGLGTDDTGYNLGSNPHQQSLQPTYLQQNSQQIQGGAHNQGMTPLQGSRFVHPIQAQRSNWYDY